MTSLRFCLLLSLATGLAPATLRAEDASPPEVTTSTAAPATAPEAVSAALTTVRAKLADVPGGLQDKERADYEALAGYYAGPQGKLLWTSDQGFTARAAALVAEIKNANAYGLDSQDFVLPAGAAATTLTPDQQGEAEVQLSLAALKYARFARGGRITDPAAQLNSNLDRRPQWIDPKVIVERLAGNEEPDAVLRALHPKHPQFEKLRMLYVTALPKGGAPLSPAAKRLRANMEMWRWMNDDMGDMHVFNNIPEFMQYVYKDGKIIRTEKIVAGETSSSQFGGHVGRD